MDEQNLGSILKEWLGIIASAFIIAFVIHTFILSSTIIDGSSMNPTLEHRDRLLVNRVSAHLNRYSRGDIVEFKAPDRDGDYIKRIIGLPGDVVEIIEESVYVNGERIIEDYTSAENTLATRDTSRWIIEEGEAFVLGDNRLPGASHDSRSFGPIPIKSIVGTAFFRFLPPGRIGRL